MAHRDHFVGRLSIFPSVPFFGSHTFLVVASYYVFQATHAFPGMLPFWFLCRLRSIAAHRDHFVRRLSVCVSVRVSGSHTFLLVTHSYVLQATHAFFGMLHYVLAVILTNLSSSHHTKS